MTDRPDRAPPAAGDVPAQAQPGTSVPYAAWLRAQRAESRWVRLAQLCLVAGFLVLWEVCARKTWVNPLFTSYPSAVWAGFVAMVQEGGFFRHVAVTTTEIVVSFVVSTVAGVILAVLLWLQPFTRRVLAPFVVVVNAIPKIALVPIFYIWLGPTLSIYAIGISVSIFIVLIMMTDGFLETDPNQVKLVRAFGADTLQLLRLVILPRNVPTLISVMKANVGMSVVGVVVGEFQSAKAGLGYLITYGSQTFQMDRVIASVVVLALISIGAYFAVIGLEKSLVRYR